ncbi:MAG: acetoin:2,6-dichlorophenolindophenol oxidoreductase subunit alpha [Mycobacteriales bacterium]
MSNGGALPALDTDRRLAADAATAADVLATMWRIRLFEETVDELFARGLMHGTMHLSIGQEATATGGCRALSAGDLITSTHRGHCIARGADLTRMMAELLGKETGYCRGRGGSMHIADVATGNLGANGIAAGGIPIAVGAALAQRPQGRDRVALAFFGDGATNEGAFHEAVNLAAIWSLPVVFCCENNQYGMSMAATRAVNVPHLADRAAAYGLPGSTVDGNGVQAVYEAVGAAVTRARSGAGPTLVEAVTYRWKGHSKRDKNLYRSRAEIDEWRARDQIAAFTATVLDAGTLTESELDSTRAAARETIRSAVREAQAAPAATRTGCSPRSTPPPTGAPDDRDGSRHRPRRLDDAARARVRLGAARALQLNAIWTPDGPSEQPEIGVALAVDTPVGLLAPVLPAPDRGPLADVDAAVRRAAERARTGRLLPSDLDGATTTVSNLGGFGVDAFQALLTPPQATILSLGRLGPRPAVLPGGGLAARVSCTVGRTVDHRAADGADAARLLAELAELTAAPGRLLAGG